MVESGSDPLSIDLIALYLPGGSIEKLPLQVMTSAKGGSK